MGSYTIHVVGESFNNEDGSRRQEELARCRVGEAVALEWDPHNPYDSNCVKVVSARGVQVGNIGRENADWIAARIEQGGWIEGVINSIGHGETGLLGCVLTVRTTRGETIPHPASAAPPSPQIREGVAARPRWVLPVVAGGGFFAVALAVIVATQGQSAADRPAVSSHPEYEAEAAISIAGGRCDGVAIAERLASGTIVAECRSGQRYRIVPIAGGQVSVQRVTPRS